ncbi:transcriptional regulator [Listeria marthii]|uniref:Transcriptional regulator n=1 Tax=Listeria swaminathanii TaxID=2713501 RepID=A0A7X1A171_9LIST|nr:MULTISPECIES: ArpU family phage packaging/lysis transcriptional regulator [Listeria]MBC1996720.1 transcriptional regulator [Listeria marthii]MBC2001965.1 transcriptional regulator [Listeria marthii]MBC2013250.1 transcriptional regulator [Listeria marthii]MBC2062720.1 transcriptional regulator [Listeria marthii]MBC2075856.1 transcriptional regulator [Listeria marthii]
MSATKNNIDYIKTVQNVKSFFEEFQYLVFLLGSKNELKLRVDGILEVTNNQRQVELTAIGSLVKLYIEILNTMNPLHRYVLVKCYVDKQKDDTTLIELPYKSAQYKKIKKQAVLALAEELEIIVEKK